MSKADSLSIFVGLPSIGLILGIIGLAIGIAFLAIGDFVVGLDFVGFIMFTSF
jgi:hypothetical protein